MNRLSSKAFEKLLETLGPDRESAAGVYEELRQRLERFFRWESCPRAEECATEVLTRLASKLLEGERILNPVAHAGSIARLVLKETNLKQAREQQLPLASPVSADAAGPLFVSNLEESPSQAATTLQCFDRCFAELPAESRQLLLDYYRGEAANRIVMLQQPLLRKRALLLRESLEARIEKCSS